MDGGRHAVQVSFWTYRKRICLWSPAGIHFRPIAPTICAADYRAPSKPLFQKLGIFDIYSLLSFQVGSFMYLCHHEMLPLSFQNLFQTGSQIHNYSTRYTESYCPHACRTKIKNLPSYTKDRNCGTLYLSQ